MVLEPIVKHVIATSIEHAWYSALDMVMTKGRKYLISSGSFEKTYRKTSPLVIEIHNPGTRPLAPLMPEGSSISPPTTEEAIHKYVESLISPEKQPGQHYTYGQDLSWQIEEVIKYFKKYGFNTACCQMPVGRPESIFFYNRDIDYDEMIIVKDRATGKVEWTRCISNSWNKDEKEEVSTQCLRSVDVWIENNKLYFWCYFRSQDLWGGFPENYGGLQLVKEYMAGMLGIEDGPMIASGKDIHVYEYAWLTAFMRLRKNPEDYL
jgi:thymidylate synthase